MLEDLIWQGHMCGGQGANRAVCSATSQNLMFDLLTAGCECGDVMKNASMIPELMNMIVGAGGSVLVWGGITAFQKSQLVVLNGHVNAQSYINDVLRPVVIPFLRPNIPRGVPTRQYKSTHCRRHYAVLKSKWNKRS